MHKFSYYFLHSLYVLLPIILLRVNYYLNRRKESKLTPYIQERVNYYIKRQTPFVVEGSDKTKVKSFKKTGGTTYYFDLYKVISHFNQENTFTYINGDVRDVPLCPSFVKSRPIHGDNENSVLLKLNAIRHFRFVNDKFRYQDKKNKVVWKGAGFRKIDYFC